MKKSILLFLIFTLPFLLVSCLDSTGPEVEEYDNTADLEFLAENAEREGVTVTESGLQYRVLEEADGMIPSDASTVFIHVINSRVDGTTLTNTYEQDRPAIIRVDNLLPGLNEGLKLMNTGEIYELVLPSELVRNSAGNPPQGVPPGALLIYEVELLQSDPEFLEVNAQGEGITVTDSGLQYRIIEEGTGSKPEAASVVEVNYTGTLINGIVFDQSTEGTPAEFSVNGVIDGFGEGLQLMNEGSIYEFFIPGSLAYGENPPQQSGIYPNATLVFEVELVSVESED